MDRFGPALISFSEFSPLEKKPLSAYGGCRLQNSRFRKAGSAVSVILECEAREPHTPAGPRRFSTRSSLSFDYGPSLAFAKNTAVLQFNGGERLKTINSCFDKGCPTSVKANGSVWCFLIEIKVFQEGKA